MSDNLFKDSLLHGNLEVIYSLREIKKFRVKDFYEIIKDFKLSNGGIYRFFVNYKIYLTAKEFELIKENHPDAHYLLDTLTLIIDKAKELNVFDNLEIRINTCDYNSIIKVFIYNLLQLLEYKIKTYILENPLASELHDKFCQSFNTYLDIFRNEYLIINHITPIETNSFWKPSWKISYKNEDYFLEGVDTYIDNIFLYPKIICHSEIMFLELRYINQRLEYLKANTSDYFYDFIKDCVEVLSKNIFENFPLQVIYKDYYTCMKNHREIYQPELTKYLPLNSFNRDIYILSILPPYLTAYLLGYPILRADVPAYKNMKDRLEDFNDAYFDKIAEETNRKYIDLVAMGVNCGNSQNDNGDFLDVYYNRVIDFNIDDIIQVFNNGVYHIFTSPEFYDLSRKGSNFYNRSEMRTIDPIIYNLRFKRKVKRFLSMRGIKVELNSTLKENFKELKEAIKNQEITRGDDEMPRRLNFINDDAILNFLMT